MYQNSEPPDVDYVIQQPTESPLVLSHDDYYACFCFDGSLKEAADQVRKILELEEPQLRYSLNIGGGEYYLFVLHERALYLVDNKND
ncbi:MAG: hypothetical protein ACX94C_02610 [Phycisphaerales bacterium]